MLKVQWVGSLCTNTGTETKLLENSHLHLRRHQMIQALSITKSIARPTQRVIFHLAFRSSHDRFTFCSRKFYQLRYFRLSASIRYRVYFFLYPIRARPCWGSPMHRFCSRRVRIRLRVFSFAILFTLISSNELPVDTIFKRKLYFGCF